MVSGGLQRELFLEAGALPPVLAMLRSASERLRQLAAHTLAALTGVQPPCAAVQQLAAAPDTVQVNMTYIECQKGMAWRKESIR